MKKFLLVALFLVSCNKTTDTLTGVKTFEYKGGEHEAGRIDYTESPPAGGKHNPGWQNCGVYTQEIYSEYAVHSLEHGAVWITYKPDLNPAEVKTLQAAVEGRTHALLSPRSEQNAPIVMTAWNAQLALEKADDPRVNLFIQKFEQGSTAPESGASCSGAYSETK
ncbi:DUF3105 domain-containing protein [Deinococcus fonticola]|uniref:DUF3105 domain-containing protein n=1 Tax=Deinococcus fonticola TaxID=2528713 RepID=UPI001074C7DE|nr:DUF3105 domain-containing protein [Deinococcus fonticola]